jgi:hypothetical protein
MEKEWEARGARYRAWRRRERAGVATVERGGGGGGGGGGGNEV